MPSDFILSQGMLATADILVGQRPLISYFTYPIMNAFESHLKSQNNIYSVDLGLYKRFFYLNSMIIVKNFVKSKTIFSIEHKSF